MPAAGAKTAPPTAVAAGGTKTTQQPSDAIQKAMEATLASIALPLPAASASAAASTSPVVALSDRLIILCSVEALCIMN